MAPNKRAAVIFELPVYWKNRSRMELFFNLCLFLSEYNSLNVQQYVLNLFLRIENVISNISIPMK